MGISNFMLMSVGICFVAVSGNAWGSEIKGSRKAGDSATQVAQKRVKLTTVRERIATEVYGPSLPPEIHNHPQNIFLVLVGVS